MGSSWASGVRGMTEIIPGTISNVSCASPLSVFVTIVLTNSIMGLGKGWLGLQLQVRGCRFRLRSGSQAACTIPSTLKINERISISWLACSLAPPFTGLDPLPREWCCPYRHAIGPDYCSLRRSSQVTPCGVKLMFKLTRRAYILFQFSKHSFERKLLTPRRII